MATSRKRPTSGFSSTKVEPIEEIPDDPLTDEEQVETVESETIPEEIPIVENKPTFSIVPTEDPGPRFVPVEEIPQSSPPVAPTPSVKRPKQHARNVPKFSRTK